MKFFSKISDKKDEGLDKKYILVKQYRSDKTTNKKKIKERGKDMSSKRELVLKAFKGEVVDRVPVGFWASFYNRRRMVEHFLIRNY